MGYDNCISETHFIEVTKICALSPNCSLLTKFLKSKFGNYRSIRIAFLLCCYSTTIFVGRKEVIIVLWSCFISLSWDTFQECRIDCFRIDGRLTHCFLERWNHLFITAAIAVFEQRCAQQCVVYILRELTFTMPTCSVIVLGFFWQSLSIVWNGPSFRFFASESIRDRKRKNLGHVNVFILMNVSLKWANMPIHVRAFAWTCLCYTCF